LAISHAIVSRVAQPTIGEVAAQNQRPRRLIVLRVSGAAALLGFPLVASMAYFTPYPTSSWFVLSSPVLVLLAFIFLGASFRLAGGVYRGALAGAALYVLIGAATDIYGTLFPPVRGLPTDLIAQVYFGWLWPLVPYALLLRLLSVG
jgi:hypothetical protein